MLNLETFRALYPEYKGMTDYEITTRLHDARFSDVPFEQFARQFGGSTQEDAAELGARQYNAANPDNPITSADIRAKDRSGFWGGVQLLGEGVWDAVTDQFPEDIARIWRGGDIDPQQPGIADKMIERQKKDSAARIPSLQEVEGGTWAKSLYQGPRSVATSLATGVGGSLAGGAAGSAAGPAGTVVGSMVGAATASFPAFYRMAKDQFVEEVQEAVQKQRGTSLSSEEASELNALIDADAMEFGLDEAAPEALSQFFTAGLLKGGGGAFLKSLGLGGMSEAIGKRALIRIPAKLTAEIAEEEATEAMTFMGQEGIRKRYNLRKTDPTLGEFVETQAGPVAVGSLLQMGVGGAINRAFGRSYQQGQEGNNQQSEGGTTVPPTTENPQPSTQQAASNMEQPTPNGGQRPQAEDFGLSGVFGGQSYQDVLRRQQSQGAPTDRIKPVDPFDDGYDETAEWVRQNEQRVGGDDQHAVSDLWDMTKGPSISFGKTVDLIVGDYGENAPAVRQPSAMYGMNFLNQNPGHMDAIDVPYTVIPMSNAPQARPVGGNARIPLMSGNAVSQSAYDRTLVTPYNAPSGPAISMPSTAPVQGVVGGLSSPVAQPAGGVPMQAPRGDTTAQAEGLGMRAPDTVPEDFLRSHIIVGAVSSPAPASSPAWSRSSGRTQQLFSSSTVDSSSSRKPGRREGRAYTVSWLATDRTARCIIKMRPPASSSGSPMPPAARNTRLLRRLKESTSA